MYMWLFHSLPDFMKRKAPSHWDSSRGGWTPGSKRIKMQGPSVAILPGGKVAYAPPRREYTSSLVPLATRGYSPNSVERKVFDVAATSYNVNATGFTQALCIPTLGSDMTNRIGRKICLKSIQIQGFVNIANAKAVPMIESEVSAQYARFILLWDTQPNGALPSITDVLTTLSTNAPLNLNNRDRFRVLVDKRYCLDPFIFNSTTSCCSATNQIKPVKIYRKLNLETIFNATNGGTIADIASGSLTALWIGSDPSGLNGPVDFNGSYRVRFADA